MIKINIKRMKMIEVYKRNKKIRAALEWKYYN